ncbi:MAG: hypothetical protein ACI88A_000130 [Paraglaciecola sp.]|jgi:hypothetical protein
MKIVTRVFRRLISSVCMAAVLLLLSLTLKLHAAEFDHSYQSFSNLLGQVVQLSDDKNQSRVNYQQLALNGNLNDFLTQLSLVEKSQFDVWDQEQKLSFLINAYNAFTLKLIVDNWDAFKQGDAKSIRDLGGLFSTPWEKEFFTLFGKKHTLDDIEHKMIRGWFTEPRIHTALVCAAVSCPPLRNEAFVAEQLTQQLDKQMHLFLADNSRNEILAQGNQGEASLSAIFKWYRGDFEKGDGGFNSLFDLISSYSDALIEGDPDQQAQRAIIDSGNYPIIFKDYDWRLNDVLNF